MDKNEEAELFNLMKRASRDTRGKVLEAVTEFEWVIEIYLSNYFIGKDHNKFHDFMSLVIKPYITFRYKAETFAIIVDKVNPEFRENNKTFPTDFQAIIHNRNVLAHDPMHLMTVAVERFRDENIVGYHKYRAFKNKGKVELRSITEFTDTAIDAHVKMILHYTNEILKLLEKN